ncbi:MAG: preprotein translocase subunit YajC [Gemmatimonadales bacterium]
MTASLFSLSLMAPADGSGTGMTVMLVQFGVLIAIFYFLLIRPQSQARKKHAELLAGLKKGDEVVTSGGLMGKVKEIKDQRITVETCTATVWVERSRIVQVGDVSSPTASQ